jgi:peptide-methionine (S)-S-oxide reductase
LFHNQEQQKLAIARIAELTNKQAFDQPIVTSVKAANNFYSAESYHQDYVTKNPENKYCQLVVVRKIQKFLNEFSYLLKDEDLIPQAS